MTKDIGVVGIGTMGFLAAKLLIDNGANVVVSDINTTALDEAKALGANIADSPKVVAENSDIILLSLPGPTQIIEVVTGKQGILQGANAGAVIIDLSTVDPKTTRDLGAIAAQQQVDYLDAPILGRPSAVGHWVLPVGGEAQVIDQCRPVLEQLGREIIHVGPLGAGNTLKLLNALMFSAINAMTAEMMAISAKAGLDPAILFQIIGGSDAATVSGLFKEVGQKIVERDFTPTFPIDLLCKDNGLAIQMAKDSEAPPILANAIQTMNELALAKGLGQEDTSALVKVYETLLSVKVS
ncbi:MAG: NAD(P)-dependent oxidoreductase [Chloroflexota bacterium]